MTSIDKNGFLSQEIYDWIKENRSKYKDIFLLSEEINQFAHRILFQVNPHNNNEQELLIALLYNRALSTFQGIIILSERGLINEGKVLLRSLVEIMYALIASSKYEDIAKKYLLNDIHESSKMINKLKNSSLKKIPKFYIPLLKREKEIENVKKEKNVNKLTIEQLSRKADLYEHHLTIYPFLCNTVHSAARDIGQSLDLKKNIIRWGPDVSNIDGLILATTAEFLRILESTIEFFKINESHSIKDFFRRVMKL